MANELIGVKELNAKLGRLDRATGIKTLRSSLFKATTPVVRIMKSRIPVGTKAHRTYRKRLVSPGFARRSIKRLTGKKYVNQGKLSIAIGVKAEAFYVINMLDQGPHTVTRRRQQTSTKARGHSGYQRRNATINSYVIRKQPWFESSFIAGERLMIGSFKNDLSAAILKAVR